MITETAARFYVVRDADLAKLRDLHRRRDEQAHIAGVALLGAMQREAEIITNLADRPDERNQRLGALRYEFLTASKQCERLIHASCTDEAELGETVLRGLGLNLDREELRIDISNGLVLILRDGSWVPRERG